MSDPLSTNYSILRQSRATFSRISTDPKRRRAVIFYSSHAPHSDKHLEKREVSKNLSLCCTPGEHLLYQHRVGSSACQRSGKFGISYLEAVGTVVSGLPASGPGSSQVKPTKISKAQTASRFEGLTQRTWSDCQRAGEEIVAFGVKTRGASFRTCPSPGDRARRWRQGSGRASRSALEDGGSSRPAKPSSRDDNLCLLDIRTSHFPTEHSTSGSGQRAERLGWEKSPRTVFATTRQRPPQPRGKGFAGNPGTAPV
jgi:hypothetical protein